MTIRQDPVDLVTNNDAISLSAYLSSLNTTFALSTSLVLNKPVFYTYNTYLLHIAIYLGHIETIQILLQNGGSTFLQDDRNRNAVMCCIYGVDVESITEENWDVVKNVERTDILLELMNYTLEEELTSVVGGVNALCLAAYLDKVNIIECLTTKVNINIRDINGSTALMYAAREGHVNSLQALFKLGANPMIIDNSNKGVMDYAQKNVLEMVKEYQINFNLRIVNEYLLSSEQVFSSVNRNLLMLQVNKNKNEYNQLIRAIERVDVVAVHSLLNLSKQPKLLVNMQNEEKMNALHILCRGVVSIQIMNLLLYYGVDINQTTRINQTALHLLCTRNDVEEKTIQLLLSYGINTDVTDSDGNSALHYACQVGILSVAQVLIQVTNANIKNKEGKKALEYMENTQWLLSIKSKLDETEKVKHIRSNTCPLTIRKAPLPKYDLVEILLDLVVMYASQIHRIESISEEEKEMYPEQNALWDYIDYLEDKVIGLQETLSNLDRELPANNMDNLYKVYCECIERLNLTESDCDVEEMWNENEQLRSKVAQLMNQLNTTRVQLNNLTVEFNEKLSEKELTIVNLTNLLSNTNPSFSYNYFQQQLEQKEHQIKHLRLALSDRQIATEKEGDRQVEVDWLNENLEEIDNDMKSTSDEYEIRGLLMEKQRLIKQLKEPEHIFELQSIVNIKLRKDLQGCLECEKLKAKAFAYDSKLNQHKNQIKSAIQLLQRHFKGETLEQLLSKLFQTLEIKQELTYLQENMPGYTSLIESKQKLLDSSFSSK